MAGSETDGADVAVPAAAQEALASPRRMNAVAEYFRTKPLCLDTCLDTCLCTCSVYVSMRMSVHRVVRGQHADPCVNLGDQGACHCSVAHRCRRSDRLVIITGHDKCFPGDQACRVDMYAMTALSLIDTLDRLTIIAILVIITHVSLLFNMPY